MTMRWTDGFFTAENATTLATKYDYVNTASMSPTYGRSSLGTNSYGATPGSGTGAYAVKSLKSVWGANTPIFVGFRYKPAASTNGQIIFAVRSSDTTDAQGYDLTGTLNSFPKNALRSVFLTTAGGAGGTTVGFTVRRCDSSGQALTPDPLFTSSATALSTTTFNYIEMAVYPGSGGTGGRVVVRLNGTQVYDSGATISWNYTPSLGFNEVLPFGIYNPAGGTLVAGGTYADMYVCDNTGTTNNNFLGDTTIETVLPNANGTTQQFSLVGKNQMPTVDSASFEGGVGGWASNNGWSLSTNSGGATQGTSYLFIINSFGTNQKMQSPTGTSGIPVLGSQVYTLAYDFAIVSLNTGSGSTYGGYTNMKMTVDWYTSAGVFISTSTQALTTPSSAAWARNSLVATSPANAAFASVGFQFDSTNGTGNDRLGIDGVLFASGDMTVVTNGTQYVAPGATTAFGALAETSPDLDGSYVRSSTSGSIEAFKYTLASASGLVAAVNFAPIIKRETLGSSTLLPAMRTRTLPTVVEAAQSSDWNASGHTDTMSNPTQAGDLVLFWAIWSPTFPVSNISGLGATWTNIYNDTASPSMGLWVGTNCSAGLNQINSQQASGSSTAKTAWMLIRGAPTTTPVVAQSTNSGTLTSYANAAIATTFPNQLVVNFWQSLVGSGYTPLSTVDSPGGFTVDFNGNARGTASRVEMSHRIASEAGAQSHQVNTNNAAASFRYYSVVIEAVMANVAGSSSVSTPADTSYHQATGIIETNLAATSRPLTIAEFNAAEFGLQVP